MSLRKESSIQRRSSIQTTKGKNGGLIADSKLPIRNKMSSSLNKHVAEKTPISKSQAEIKSKTDKLIQQLNSEEREFEDLLKLLKR